MNAATVLERLKWVDIAKGIGIFLVIIGHMPSVPENIRLWVFSFHMPLFFYLSGYFAQPMNLTVKAFILKKAKTLLIPYLFYSVIFILSDYFILGLGKDIFQEGLVRMAIGQGGSDILWFFVSLFIVDILFLFLYRASKSAKVLYLFIGISIIIGYLGNVFRIGGLFKIAPSLFAIGFYSIGYWTNKVGLYNREIKSLTSIFTFIGAAFINIMGSVIIIKRNCVILDLNNNRAFDIILTYIIALCGIYCIIAVARYIEGWKFSKIVTYIGRNSLYFYPLTGYIPNAIVIFLNHYGMVASGGIKVISKVMGFIATTGIVEFSKIIWSKKRKDRVYYISK